MKQELHFRKEATLKSLLALALLVPASVWSQDKPTLNARELFYTPAPDPPAVSQTKQPPTTTKQAEKKQPAQAKSAKSDAHVVAASVPLGLRYSVLKRDSAGTFQEVDPDTIFHSGDRIRIRVEANTSGYLYVVTQGTSGMWKPLFPSAEVAAGSNRVDKGDSRMIPSGDSGQFVFNEQGGVEKLFLVLTRQPETDLDKLIYSMGGTKDGDPGKDRLLMAQASVQDDVVSKLRAQLASRDLVFEKVDSASAQTGGRIENAAYVVNPSTAPDARLVVDLALKHK